MIAQVSPRPIRSTSSRASPLLSKLCLPHNLEFLVPRNLRSHLPKRAQIRSRRRGSSRLLSSKAVAYNTSFSLHYIRSEEHTSELQSLTNLVCRLLLEKKKQRKRAGLLPRVE